MKIFSPTISGSSQASGSLTISGNLNISQGITGSLLGTASWAINVVNGGGGGSTDTGSLLKTASVNLNTITFTKGDGSTFPITVNTGSGGGGSIGTLQQVTEQGASTTVPITASIVSASSFTGSLFGTASHAITASYALSSAGGGGGSFSLAGATDVSFSALADGDLIRYSSIAGKWQNTNLGLSLTPTLSAIEGGYFGGYARITNWGSYSAPLAQAFIKSGSTVIITCSVNSSGQITWSDSNSNYNFTRSLEVQVQDFGDIASEITTASYVKQEASFRYFRYYAVSASSYVWIGELRYYSGSAQSGTAFPSNMTSNTAPSPYVISASNFYVGYEPWKAFDNSNSTYWWNLAAPPYQGAYITVDMGPDFTSSIRSMRVLFGSTYQDFTFANFQGSNDNITWTTIHTITNVPANNISTMRNFG